MHSSQDQPQQTFPLSPNNPVLARTIAVLRLPTSHLYLKMLVDLELSIEVPSCSSET
jgi:hypothetical protein